MGIFNICNFLQAKDGPLICNQHVVLKVTKTVEFMSVIIWLCDWCWMGRHCRAKSVVTNLPRWMQYGIPGGPKCSWTMSAGRRISSGAYVPWDETSVKRVGTGAYIVWPVSLGTTSPHILKHWSNNVCRRRPRVVFEYTEFQP
jgi:hypothetical protein